ncbi:MAG: 30S ribosomal protein S6 [Minisyncoccales bacterium]
MSKTKILTKIYELAFLIPERKEKEDAFKLYEKINSFLQEQGSLLIDFYSPQLFSLAYKIKKEKSAYLASTTFQLKVEKIEKVKEEIKKLEKEGEILRFLLFVKKIKK